MTTPLDERTRYRRLAFVAAVLLAVFLLDLGVSGPVDAAVWVFVVALLLSGLWLGASFGGRVQAGAVVSTASRRRTSYGLALAAVVVVVIGLSRALDVERTTFQDVLSVAGVGIAAFVLTLSVTVLRHLPSAGSVVSGRE